MGPLAGQAEGVQAGGQLGRHAKVAGSVCILQVEETGLLRWGAVGAEGEARCASWCAAGQDMGQPLRSLQAGFRRAGVPLRSPGV